MIPVKLTKQRAEYLVGCFRDGTPIVPPAGGWSGNDMLALGGAAFAAALSQGPESWWLRANDTRSMQPEHAELVEETFDNDLHAAIGFYGHLVFLALDHTWDEHLEEEVQCLVSQEGTIKKKMEPVKGFKTQPNAGD
jgi:hypothetical protein